MADGFSSRPHRGHQQPAGFGGGDEGGFDLILIGREFGDHDVGVIAACLAAELDRPFFALVQAVRWDGDRLELLREQGVVEETVGVEEQLVASVTNDRRNRLRHPLMKNVMEAKRAVIPVVVPPSWMTSS